MGYQTWSVAPNNGASGATTIQAWGKALSDALAASGLVKTADTGQINWATVTTPSAATTAAGYEIWRLTDALQSTAPIFIKLEYGSGNPLASPSLWFTIGSATDGAGAITGTVIRARTQLTSANGTTPRISYLTSDGSSLYLAMFGDSTSFHQGLLIERSRDSTGAPTNKGLAVAYGVTSTIVNWYVYPLANPTLYSNWVGVSPTVAPYFAGGASPATTHSVATDTTNAPAIPVILYAVGVPAWVLQIGVIVLPGDQASNIFVSVNGSTRQYRGISTVTNCGLVTSYLNTQALWHLAMWVA